MTYKILSLDAGGVSSLIQVRVLMDIYGDVKGNEILRKFNLAIANPGGSFILACLCYNMKLSDILKVYTDKTQRDLLFPKLNWWEKLKMRNIMGLIFRSFGPMFSTQRKAAGIRTILDKYDLQYLRKRRNYRLGDYFLTELPEVLGINIDIVIGAFDYIKESEVFFRSEMESNTDKFTPGPQVSLFDAVNASCNLPVSYFEAPARAEIHYSEADKRNRLYWSGSIGRSNNPVLAGLVEAMTNNYEGIYDYSILSLGTGAVNRVDLTDYKNSTDPEIQQVYLKNRDNPYVITEPDLSLSNDIKKIMRSRQSHPADSESFIAYAMLDPSLSNIAALIRINPFLAPVKGKDAVFRLPGSYQNDQYGKVKFLSLLDMDYYSTKDEGVDLIMDICDKFIAGEELQNQLIRGSKDDQHYLGQATYQDAKEKWAILGMD